MDIKLVLKRDIKEHLISLMDTDEKTINFKLEFEEKYLTERYEEYQERKCNLQDIFSYFTLRGNQSKTGLEYLIKLELKDCDVEETE